MINSGDTAFVLISTALVMFMTPGLALFYGGLVRSKNVLSIVMQSFICLGVVSLIWIIYGYSLAFGSDLGGFGLIGNFDNFFLKGVSINPAPDSTIPEILFCAFQMMFAVITPALITGAFAERIKFKAFLFFTILWTTFVYLPVCHWVWGEGGWILDMGALDFAGGAVIHINSAVAALITAIAIGKRNGWRKQLMLPHNIPITVLGAGILWFGWFGFNAGSALAADSVASLAFITTHIAAAAAAVSWMLIEWFGHGKPTVVGVVTGAVAGLVAITPAAGFVEPVAALIIGLVAGILCYYAIRLKSKLGYDDALGVHGIGGIWGALAVGIFASVGAKGLFYGNPDQLTIQAISIISVIVFSCIMTYIIFKIIDLTVGVRVSKRDEIEGLDISEHNESGYEL